MNDQRPASALESPQLHLGSLPLPDAFSESTFQGWIEAAGLSAADIELLHALQAALERDEREYFAELDAFLDTGREPNPPASHGSRPVAAIKQAFRQLLGTEVTFESVCDHMQLWVQLRHSGLTLEWATAAYTRYLKSASLAAQRLCAADSERYAALAAALQKMILFHLGLIGHAFLDAERASYRYHMLYDSGTDLPNATLVEALLDKAIDAARAREGRLALIRLQLSPSHRFLGMPGYPSYEALMRQVAARLASIMRGNDILGRLSKDEFAIALPDLKSEGFAMLAAHKVLRTLEPRFALENLEITVNSTLGVALYPAHAQDAKSMLRVAEVARVQARSSPENYLIYHEDFDSGDRLQTSLELDLRTALRENDLLLYFQPQLDLHTAAVTSCEALLRWKKPNGEFVPPNLIVSVAEQCGLIQDLTQWVVKTALRQAADMRKHGIDIVVGVNLSAENLLESEFTQSIDQQLRTWGVPANRLLLEITEGSMVRDMDKVLVLLERLKLLGVKLSIDDFGQGYSCLAYLPQLPIHELKIDKAFVQDMLKKRAADSIVRSIIELAHNLDHEVVAEGVEDAATLAALKERGCDKIQGYFISRPIPHEAFKQWWHKQAAAPALC
jgi:diguanylate cyclase (GGDEF)-like protein